MPTSEMSRKPRYWDGKFVLTNAVLLLLAAVAAYLEYSVYPTIMTQTYFETSPSLQFSFLTYRWNALKCLGTDCTHVLGVPALDFVQIFIIVIILMNLSHFISFRRNQGQFSLSQP